MSAPTVFISYSHDSSDHSERVLSLSERLRDDGITTHLDQYENGTPSKGWPRWMLDQLDDADSVIVVCTKAYYRRFRGHEEPAKGKGADWEGALITQEIYEERSNTVKFLPVLFAAEDEAFIPEPIRGLTSYLLNSEENYNDLYDFLLGQAGVEPRAVGNVKIKERRRAEPLKFGVTTPAPGKSQIAPSRLHHGADHLFGRDEELAALDKLASDPSKKVLTIVAFGGVGKTSLVIEWMARQAAKNWEGWDRVFDWSFFSQGTREQGDTASAEGFVAAALRFFGDEPMAESAASPWDKGARLAQLVTERRTLLVLDGVEPLQHPPGPLAGELKDPALATLLKGLARSNSGFCIVTTRERVADLATFRDTTAPAWQLHHLSIPAGVELLKTLGVRGTAAEFQQLVNRVKGHALTLNLLGHFLAKAHRRDIRKSDQVRFEKADAATQGGYAFKTIGAYERWLNDGGEEGARQLAVLRLLGLFDRPADPGCMTALRSAPAIADLTEPLVGLDEADWNLTISSLTEAGLATVQSDESPIGNSQFAIDAHPLIREYFAKERREKNPESWQGAHRRLYEYLRDTTKEGGQPTLEDLEPLYQAVAHGCQGGLHQEVCDDVYFTRILRKAEFYSTSRLGAYSSDLSAVAWFFEIPWVRVAHLLRERDQAFILNSAAHRLRCLSRISEALEPTRVALEKYVQLRSWGAAARVASNLSELRLILGKTDEAVSDAKQSVIYADQSTDDFAPFVQWLCRTAHAFTLQQVGQWREAEILYARAEQIYANNHPERSTFPSPANFNHCALLTSKIERDAWRCVLNRPFEVQIAALESCQVARKRTQQALDLARIKGPTTILEPALDHLTLGAATLYDFILDSSRTLAGNSAQPTDNSLDLDMFEVMRHELNTAVDGLRRAGTQDVLPRGLLARAWLRFLTGTRTGPESAHEDLDEAWQIAERGPMRLYMADIHLYRARLFHAVKPYPWNKFSDGAEGRGPKDDLADARKLIEKCGYWRRKEELEDAEEAAKGWT